MYVYTLYDVSLIAVLPSQHGSYLIATDFSSIHQPPLSPQMPSFFSTVLFLISISYLCQLLKKAY